MRQIVLDTETTGLEPEKGHRIIEIGCIELINRQLTGKYFHCYINPEREIDAGAISVHGINNEFLADKPKFAEISAEFLAFIKDAELIIHNAPFDIGFLNAEFKRLRQGLKRISEYCKVLDTLPLAREKHPGQRNSLDALCKRYGVDNSNRNFHGGLLDAELLAFTYLAMTSGQENLFSEHTDGKTETEHAAQYVKRPAQDNFILPIIQATAEELTAHEERLVYLAKQSQGKCVWKG